MLCRRITAAAQSKSPLRFQRQAYRHPLPCPTPQASGSWNCSGSGIWREKNTHASCGYRSASARCVQLCACHECIVIFPLCLLSHTGTLVGRHRQEVEREKERKRRERMARHQEWLQVSEIDHSTSTCFRVSRLHRAYVRIPKLQEMKSLAAAAENSQAVGAELAEADDEESNFGGQDNVDINCGDASNTASEEVTLTHTHTQRDEKAVNKSDDVLRKSGKETCREDEVENEEGGCSGQESSGGDVGHDSSTSRSHSSTRLGCEHTPPTGLGWSGVDLEAGRNVIEGGSFKKPKSIAEKEAIFKQSFAPHEASEAGLEGDGSHAGAVEAVEGADGDGHWRPGSHRSACLMRSIENSAVRPNLILFSTRPRANADGQGDGGRLESGRVVRGEARKMRDGAGAVMVGHGVVHPFAVGKVLDKQPVSFDLAKHDSGVDVNRGEEGGGDGGQVTGQEEWEDEDELDLALRERFDPLAIQPQDQCVEEARDNRSRQKWCVEGHMVVKEGPDTVFTLSDWAIQDNLRIQKLAKQIEARREQERAAAEKERAAAEKARQAAETKQRRYKCADPACTFLVHAEPAPWNGDGRYCCENCMNGVPHDVRCGRIVAPADARTKDPFYHMLRKREQRLRRLKLQELQHLRSSPIPDVPPIALGISSCA